MYQDIKTTIDLEGCPFLFELDCTVEEISNPETRWESGDMSFKTTVHGATVCLPSGRKVDCKDFMTETEIGDLMDWVKRDTIIKQLYPL